MCEYQEALLTVLEDTNEQGLVRLAVPPVNWDLGVEGLRNPDVQLAVKDRRGDVASQSAGSEKLEGEDGGASSDVWSETDAQDGAAGRKETSQMITVFTQTDLFSPLLLKVASCSNVTATNEPMSSTIY